MNVVDGVANKKVARSAKMLDNFKMSMQLRWVNNSCTKRAFVSAGRHTHRRHCHSAQSTESPIFDASFWSEIGVSCPQCGHERNKIGDSVI
jgi:hypothetical protein